MATAKRTPSARLGLAIGLLCVAAAPARGAILDYDATLRIVIPNLGIDVASPNAVGATSVTPAAGGAHFGLPPGIFAIGATQGTSASLSGTVQIHVTSNQAGGTFGLNGGLGPGFGGPMPLNGAFVHGNFLATSATPSGSTFLTTTTVSLPITPIGGGGTVSTSRTMGSTSQVLTYFLFGDRFTTHPASNGTSMRTGFDARTANGVGSLQMVVPFHTESSPNYYSYGFAILDITFTPEPGRALALGAGAVLLVLLGTRRARK